MDAEDPGARARRRAASAGQRAEELRIKRQAADRGGRPSGSTASNVEAAAQRARTAVTRLAVAYESSAAAHDRAAAEHDRSPDQSCDPDGAHVRAAAVHREAAARDRAEAAALPTPDAEAPPAVV
jgi:hypothetical protein